MTTSASAKKKRVSRKNKTAWRKNVDITDVEEFLETQRQDERIGDLSIKANDELFMLDDKDDPSLLVTAREKRKMRAKQPQKGLTPLINTSNVQDPIVKRNHVKIGDDRKSDFVKAMEANSKDKIKRKHIEAIINRKNAAKRFKKKPKVKGVYKKDIWSEDPEKEVPEEFKDQFVPEEIKIYQMKNLGKPIVKTPQISHEKRSKLRAVSPPHPGLSYNPSSKDHDDLLEKVLVQENEIIKKEKHLNRVTVNMFRKVTEDERDIQKAVELLGDDEIKTEPESDDETLRVGVNPPVENKKKDRKSRRKQREQRELAQKRRELKQEKAKITDIHRLKQIKKEIEKITEQSKKLKEMKRKKLEAKKLLPKRLGKHKFEEPEVPLNSTDKLTGNLRNVSAELSILADRFKSFQKRNLLVPNKLQMPSKKPKVKRYIKKTHKEPEQPFSKKMQRQQMKVKKESI